MSENPSDTESSFEFECGLCGNSFPAEPGGVFECVPEDEAKNLDKMGDVAWDELEQKEIVFVCPYCQSRLKKYGDSL